MCTKDNIYTISYNIILQIYRIELYMRITLRFYCVYFGLMFGFLCKSEKRVRQSVSGGFKQFL